MTLKELPIDKTWTLFLDRDGVLNERRPGDYVKNQEELILLPGVLKAMAAFSRLFGAIFIVTNQQGIGKGLMTEEDLRGVHELLTEEVHRAGGFITKIYYEPRIAGADNKRRKPAIGMGLDAQKEFPEINFKKAVMVGDSPSDILFGKRLGMWTIKVGSPFQEADFEVVDLMGLSRQLSYYG